MRKLEKNRNTPTVALTANAISGARQMYLNAGFNDYVSKPVDGVKLEKLLLGLLPKDKIILAESVHDIIQEKVMKDRSVVLVVDDDETVCKLVESVMKELYDTVTCLTGKDAVSTAKKHQPDLILLDIHLKDSNGFAVMHELKKDELTSDIPVLLITGDNDDVMEEKGFMNGAADYIRKPFSPEVLRQRTKRIIDLSHYQKSIEAEVLRQTSRSNRLSREIMLTLSRTVDIKDHYTDGHSRRVAAISAEIARRLGKSVEEQNEQYEIGLLHDIGKIGIHDDIIHKTTRLSDDEFKKIKDHTIKGYEILKEIQDMPKLWEGARWHHERYDGSGYPDGLAGDNIPEVARIVCIADCYDAMTSTRTYSEPRKQEEVRAEIERCSGTWFDPRVAETLLAMIDEDKSYRMTEKSTGSDVWKGYDRFWKYDEAVNSLKPAGDELPGWLGAIDGLDVAAGIKNCGSAEGYMSVLSVFHQTALDKAAEIKEFWDNKDIENYTIRVHALKSSARIIGMAELSKLAERLEMAGKRSDTGFIKDNNDRLLAMYKEMDDNLSALDEGTGSGDMIDKASLRDAYNTIIEVAGTMDYSLMEELLKGLREYELPSSDSENIKEVEKFLTQLDWEGIESVAKRALNSQEES